MFTPPIPPDEIEIPMTQGEYNSMAINEFAMNNGIEQPEREWILTPFDTWVRNPAFTGTPGPHPEDDLDFYD